MDEKPLDPSQVDSINNLETARMTLRWALERLAALEKKSSEESKGRQEAQKEASELRASQRELYYKKLEDFVGLHLAGRLGLLSGEAPLALRRDLLDREQEAHLARLRDKEAEVSIREKEAEKRRAAIEDEARHKEARLRAEAARARSGVEEENRLRQANADKLWAERLADERNAWRKEKEELISLLPESVRAEAERRLSALPAPLPGQELEEARKWRWQAQEQLARIAELERGLEEATEQAKMLSDKAELERLRRDAERAEHEKRHRELSVTAEAWQQAARQELEAQKSLEQGASETAQALRQAQADVDELRLRLERDQSAAAAERERTLAELAERATKAEQLEKRVGELWGELTAAREGMRAAAEASARDAERCRTLEHSLMQNERESTAKLGAAQSSLARVEPEASAWRQRADERLVALQEAQRRLADTEAALEKATRALSDRRSVTVEARRDTAALQEEISRQALELKMQLERYHGAQRISEERLKDLETKLALAHEEALKERNAAADERAAAASRLEEQSTLRAEAEQRARGLEAELARAAAVSQDELRRLRAALGEQSASLDAELARAAAVSQDELRRLRAALEEQSASLNAALSAAENRASTAERRLEAAEASLRASELRLEHAKSEREALESSARVEQNRQAELLERRVESVLAERSRRLEERERLLKEDFESKRSRLESLKAEILAELGEEGK